MRLLSRAGGWAREVRSVGVTIYVGCVACSGETLKMVDCSDCSNGEPLAARLTRRYGVTRQACSNATANAATEAKRCSGSFVSAVKITLSTSRETPAILPYRGGGGISTCWLAISANDPWKGRSPLRHSSATI